MPQIANRGIFIAVEGIDGAGKTTQVRLLADELRKMRMNVVTSKEPTDGLWGRKIRESASSGRFPADEELRLFILDRTEHSNTLVRPALERGDAVILDRYYYSSIAYQGSRGQDYRAVQAIMEERFPRPDAVFLLDIDPEVSLARIRDYRKETPNEFETVQSLARAREVFNSIDDPRIERISGVLSIAEVHALIMMRVQSLLAGRVVPS